MPFLTEIVFARFGRDGPFERANVEPDPAEPRERRRVGLRELSHIRLRGRQEAIASFANTRMLTAADDPPPLLKYRLVVPSPSATRVATASG